MKKVIEQMEPVKKTVAVCDWCSREFAMPYESGDERRSYFERPPDWLRVTAKWEVSKDFCASDCLENFLQFHKGKFEEHAEPDVA